MKCFRCGVNVDDIEIHECALGGPIRYKNTEFMKGAKAMQEAAILAFKNEYANHDDPLIGVVRGLAAISALAPQEGDN